MAKVVAFSLLSLAVAGAVIYWALGAQAPVARVMKAKPSPGPTPPAATQDGISVYFSPNGGITEALVRQISNAKTSVYVQAAQFTSVPIARALVDAHKRGLDVRVILDKKKDDDDHSQTDRLVDSGVPTFADGRHHTAHNKIMIIDHRLITTGSFNFTRESEADNAENLVMIFDKADLVAAYESNFKQHLAHSKPYEK
jgi:phosphatidylserine/phosphatidylglycerophosphate/cardiolipin synthase-like enzyme